jgi:hypothetical protein
VHRELAHCDLALVSWNESSFSKLSGTVVATEACPERGRRAEIQNPHCISPFAEFAEGEMDKSGFFEQLWSFKEK